MNNLQLQDHMTILVAAEGNGSQACFDAKLFATRCWGVGGSVISDDRERFNLTVGEAMCLLASTCLKYLRCLLQKI
jgi:hypothetical protein